MWKLKLVEDWKDGWKWISTNCMGLAAAMLASWDSIPPEWRSYLPTDDMPTMVTGLLIIGIVGRFLDQAKPSTPSEPSE